LQRQTIAHDLSILSQRRDPEELPELAHLADRYERIRLYREWTFGRNSVFRTPQAADLRGDILEENLLNLGLFLNHLRGFPKAKTEIRLHLRDLYDGLDDFDVSVRGGTVEVFLTEGDFVFPASRLSDGTLRYLCLLAILCDPNPPPLICLEEPELGLHPDLLPRLADLLLAASQRTQLVVTTHSDILIDSLTDHPEYVVVCEKQNHQTTATRLSREKLGDWLKDYRLGELWTRGQIGGVRW
jgi:predicted ATPase